MARPRSADARFDWSKGVNTTFSPDVLGPRNLRSLKNGRAGLRGHIAKIPGSQRIHDAAIGSGANVLGLFQWDAPGAAGQIIAIANSDFYHKTLAATDFTEIASTLSTTRTARFAPWREGATIVVYFAEGALRKWNGAALTTSISNAPAATDVAIYKGRVFAIDESKTLYASKLRDGDEWQVANGAVEADVETYDTEGLIRILVVGSSLLLFKEDNIARFTGVDPQEIRIETETDGVAPDVGLIARDSLVAIDEAAMFLSQKGWYIANEAGVQPIGLEVKDEFDPEVITLADVLAQYHKDRDEVWCSRGDGKTWIYDLRSQSWAGPIDTLSPKTVARYERSDGSETLMWGGSDGFVRQEDVSSVKAKKDVLRNGTGGTAIELDAELPVILAADPGRTKTFPDVMYLQADLKTLWADPNGGKVRIYWSSELGSGYVDLTSKGPGVKSYPFSIGARGRRVTVGIRESTVELTEIYGLTLTPAMGGRKNP